MENAYIAETTVVLLHADSHMMYLHLHAVLLQIY
jgi:hypothetical protein